MTQPDSRLVAAVGAEVRAAALTATGPTIVEVFNTATATPQVFTQPYPAVSLGGAPYHRVVLDSLADLERARPSPLPPLAVAVILPQQGIAYVQLANDPAAKVVKLDRGADDDPDIRREVGTGLATLLTALTDAHAQHRATTRAHPFPVLTAPPSTPDRRSTPDRPEPTMPSPDILVEQVRHSAKTADQPTLIIIEGDPTNPWVGHTEYDPAPPGAGPEHHAQTLARFGELARTLGSTADPLAAGVILPHQQIAYLRQVDDAAVTTTVSLGPDPVDDPATRRAIEEGLGTVLESMLEGHRHAVTRARAFAVEQVAVTLGQPLPPQPSAPPTSRGR